MSDEIRPVRWREAWPYLLLCAVVAAVCGWPIPQWLAS